MRIVIILVRMVEYLPGTGKKSCVRTGAQRNAEMGAW